MRIPVISYDWKQELLNKFKKSDKTYLENSFDWADVPEGEKFEIEGTQFQEDLFDSLKVSKLSNSMGESDLKNAKIVYEGLNGLTPEYARDDRIWTALAHYFGCNYVMERHVTEEGTSDDRFNSILGSFFAESSQASGTRLLTRVHGLARLWWTAHTAKKIGAQTLEECLEIFGPDIDFRQAIMERPTNGSSDVAVAATCYARKTLLDEGSKVTRKYYRPWLVEVNLVGGGTLLAAQDVGAMTSKFEDLLRNQINQN